MSFHNKPDYHIPELIEALKAHRLPHDTPSQLADSFRIGWMAACRELAPADSVQEDAARWRMAALVGNEVMVHPDKRNHAAAVAAYMQALSSGLDLTAAIDAARAAQEGK